jgi:outer membrane murein-binding lipoprotein Lpp
MHSERVVARDGYDQEDQEFSAAKFLWAAFKAHAVMTKYAKIQELEKTIRTLQSKVDQLISKDAEKKRKEALDKLITKGGGNKVVAKNDKGQQSPQVSP